MLLRGSLLTNSSILFCLALDFRFRILLLRVLPLPFSASSPPLADTPSLRPSSATNPPPLPPPGRNGLERAPGAAPDRSRTRGGRHLLPPPPPPPAAAGSAAGPAAASPQQHLAAVAGAAAGERVAHSGAGDARARQRCEPRTCCFHVASLLWSLSLPLWSGLI